ncbi:IS110 family transposase [Streptomyces microflavus]|uniref:IS110 family transposase n=1 Tax=Streptomyces microflavus TaxID=1919 RepID=UPI003F4DFAC0
MECTGSSAAVPACFLSRQHVQVAEVDQPDRAMRRKRGKSDAADAEAAARAVLSGRADLTPKTGEGPAADMRVLRLAEGSAVKARTQAENQLNALLPGADPELREAQSELSSTALITRCAGLPDAGDAAVFTLRLPGPAHPSAHRRGEGTRRPGRQGPPPLPPAAPGHHRRRTRHPLVQRPPPRGRPMEGIWSLLRRGPPAHAAFIDPHDLTRTLRRSLRQLQYRPGLIDGCLPEIGLTITGRFPTPHRGPQQEARTSQRTRRGSR